MRAFALGRLIVFFLMLLVGGTISVVQSINRAVSYSSVLARVDRIETSCFRETGSAAEFRTGDNPRDNEECGKRSWAHPLTKVTLSLRYISPADHQEHSKEMRLFDYKKPLPEKGGTWEVLASKSNPLDVIRR